MRTIQERIHPCEGTHALADKQIHGDGFLPSSKPNEPQQSHSILNRGSRVEAHQSFNFFNRGMEDSHGICGTISANQYSFHDYMNEEDRVFGYYMVEESQNLKDMMIMQSDQQQTPTSTVTSKSEEEEEELSLSLSLSIKPNHGSCASSACESSCAGRNPTEILHLSNSSLLNLDLSMSVCSS
ncbi:hypothetical protein KSP39_PZI014842 [Platanthera zijinensis]|uniref:Uncharacterized protein n=1 Tax=Platanthera zijinensis TaxID=2320716 RepID=A0AAP0G222_9ASPA